MRILRTYIQGRALSPLTSEFRASLAAIARTVGVDEDVVRHRLGRIRESGFIGDWRLYVNASLWGGGNVHIRFDVEPTAPKKEIVEQLRLVPGMTHVAVFYDSLVALLEYEDDPSLPRQVELVRRLAGASDVALARDAFPECRISLTARDWDLLRVLRRTPRVSYVRLAAAAGLSTRTARDRLSRILAHGVAFAWPALNMRAPLGGVPIQLEVRYARERKPEVDEAITARIEPYHWHTLHLLPFRPGDPWPCGYHLIVPNLSAAREILEWAEQVPGVSRARVYVYEDLINFFDEYDAMLDRRLSRMPTAMSAARRRTRG